MPALPPPPGGSSVPLAALQRGVSVQPLAYVTNSGGATTGIVALTNPMAATSIPAFAPKLGPAANEIVVNQADLYQQFLGVGSAITDAAAYCLVNYMTAAQRLAILTEAYGTNGWSTVRICMGACDYISVPNFTYDDVANDASLTNFSIKTDINRVIPILQLIMQINPKVNIIASMWSPPAWLKTSNTIIGGNIINNTANLNTLALYYVKILQAYQSYGINVWAMTLANEPSNNAPWPSCVWQPSDLVALYPVVRAAMDAAGFGSVKIFCGDDQFDAGATYVTAALGGSASAPALDGAAFHSYSGTPVGALALLRPYPAKSWHVTERCTHTTDSLDAANAIFSGDCLLGPLNYGASSFTGWNFVIDQNGNPSNNTLHVNRGMCQVNNSGAGAITRNPEWWAVSHIAKFIKQSARRCFSTSYGVLGSAGSGIQSVAFVNPNGSMVVFIWNATATSQVITLSDATIGYSTQITLASRAIATITYDGTSPAAAPSYTAPSAPQSLTATPANYAVNLAWSAPATLGSGVGGYNLYRGTASGAETFLAALPVASTAFSDATAPTGAASYYKLTAFGLGGEGALSSEVSGTATLPALSISGAPPGTNVGSSYNFTPTTSGGVTPYTFALTGTLPAGLSFSTSTGAITGTPTTQGTTSGLNITVTDSATPTPATASLGTFSITVGVATGVAVDATAYVIGASSTSTISWAHAVGSSANLLMVGLNLEVGTTNNVTDNPYVTAVSVGGMALTKLDSITSTGAAGTSKDRVTEVWYLKNPPTGSVTITVTAPQGSNTFAASMSAGSVSYTNALSSPFGTDAKAATSSTNTTQSVSTTGGVRSVIFGTTAYRSTTVGTLGSGQTAVYNGFVSGTAASGSVFTQAGGTGAVTSSITMTTADQMAIIAVPILSN